MGLSLVTVRQREIVTVGRDKCVGGLGEIGAVNGGGIHLDEKRVGDAIPGPVKRRLLLEPSLHHSGSLVVRRVDLRPVTEQAQHVIEVPGCHDPDEGDLVGKAFDDTQRLFVVSAAVVAQVLLHGLEALRHRGCHGRLDPIAVPFELGDDNVGHEQPKPSLIHEQAHHHDPTLPVASLGQVKPRRGVDE